MPHLAVAGSGVHQAGTGVSGDVIATDDDGAGAVKQGVPAGREWKEQQGRRQKGDCTSSYGCACSARYCHHRQKTLQLGVPSNTNAKVA